MRNLLAAVACLFAGVTAQAQFSGSAEQYPTNNYASSPIAFELSAVASALNTDAATLGADLQEYIEAETPATPLFFVQQPDGTETSEPSADANGFWLTADGQRIEHGDESVFFASPSVDVENDEFAFKVGQMPNVMEAGQTASATIKLKYNGKEVTFAISLNVIAKPEYNIPEPTLIEKDLNIVGTAEVTVEQYPRTGYDADAVSVELPDLIAKLGIEQEGVLVDALDKILYTTWYNDGDVENGGGLKKDSLTNSPTGENIGYWFRAVQNESGEEYGEVSTATYGAEDKFYINNFAYDAETATLSGVLGQYPGNLKGNEKWYTNVYLVYGNKAYQVRYTLNVLEREQGNGVEGMNKVGEETVNVSLEIDAAQYSYTQIHPDMDAIAAALGVDVSSVSMQALDATDNWASATAANQGFWFNEAGIVVSWGSTAYFFIENPTSMDYTTLNVGQYPGRLSVDDEFTADLYFINAENYYKYTVNLKIVPVKVIDGEFKSVATRTLTVQQVPSGYVWSDGIEIPTDYIAEALGTSDWVVYGMALLDEDGNEPSGNAKYSKNYTITERPGFWLNADGRNSGWGSDAIFGITVGGNVSGQFQLMQYPDRCSIGDVLKTSIYFVNEETAEMVTFNFNYYVVETIENFEEVGSEDITLVLDLYEDYKDIDLTPAAEALGVTVDDLINKDNYYLYGMGDGGIFTISSNTTTGLNFDYEGNCVEKGPVYFWFEGDSDQLQIVSASDDSVAEDYIKNGAFCFQVDGKRYVYHVTFVSPEMALGISHVGTETKGHQAIYDLSGRMVKTPTRGLYIQNGKKFVVK